MLNQTVMTGKLISDPALSEGEGGMMVAYFDIAVDRDKKENGKIRTDIFTCVAKSTRATFLGAHFCKGMKVTINGKIEIHHEPSSDGSTMLPVPYILVHNIYPDGSLKDNTEKARRRAAALRPGEPVPKVCEHFLNMEEANSEADTRAFREVQAQHLPHD